MTATRVFDGIGGADVRGFSERIFSGYPEGLRDAECAVDPSLVRLGYAAFASVRWILNVAGLILDNAATDGPSAPEATEARLGWPIEWILDRWTDRVGLLPDPAED